MNVKWCVSKGPQYIVQIIMEILSVFNRIHFLLELKNASGDGRIIMLEYITLGQMACVREIVCRIYLNTFPLLIREVTYFKDRDLVLQILFSERVSFRRKVRTLLHHHRMLPRLLRTYYLHTTTQDQIRSKRES